VTLILTRTVSVFACREVNEDNMLFRNISTEFIDDSAASTLVLVSLGVSSSWHMTNLFMF
jgi:hypothetical protein